MASQWCVVDARPDLRGLYEDVHRRGALEWQAIRFWHSFLEAWRDHIDRAITVTDQAPPDEDPDSEHRLRRIDVIVDSYTQRRYTRFTLIIVEVKGAHVSAAELETVENQAQGACEAYLNAPGAETTMIYAMCTMGTKCRMFRYTLDFDWEPLWGRRTEYDLGEYIDAAEKTKGIIVWRALCTILQTPPTDMAGKDFL